MKQVVTFGEVLLRLKSPGNERLLQTSAFEATFCGSEVNVAVALANLEDRAIFVTAIPNNRLGDICLREIAKWRVDTSYIARCNGRLGTFYLEAGANQRPSVVIYDRDYSSASQMRVTDVDWDKIFSNSDWLHISGITPGLSQTACDTTLEVLKQARKNDVTVSCDLNYRKKLWNYGKQAHEIMPEILRYVDICFANEEDCQYSLGIGEKDKHAEYLKPEACRNLCEKVLSEFPRLRAVAISLRESINANHNSWAACIHDRKDFYLSRKYDITNIIDRVGSGDSFSAGMIYAIRHGMGSAESLEFAVALSCLKHSILGDFNLTSKEEVFQLLNSSGNGRVQR